MASISNLLLLFLVVIVFGVKMADSSSKPSPAKAEVHVVHMERPQDEEPESYHLRTLASVLGSDEAARDALLYSYKTAASGFSAKLTPQQVEEISKKPGVIHVAASQTYQLHSGPANFPSGPANFPSGPANF